MEILSSLLVKDGSVKIFTVKYQDKDFIVCTTRFIFQEQNVTDSCRLHEHNSQDGTNSILWLPNGTYWILKAALSNLFDHTYRWGFASIKAFSKRLKLGKCMKPRQAMQLQSFGNFQKSWDQQCSLDWSSPEIVFCQAYEERTS